MAVATLLGLGWVFGALVDTGDPASSIAFQYVFAASTTLQGFFIFLFYCVFNDHVRECVGRQAQLSVPISSGSNIKATLPKTHPTQLPSSGSQGSSVQANTLPRPSAGSSGSIPGKDRQGSLVWAGNKSLEDISFGTTADVSSSGAEDWSEFETTFGTTNFGTMSTEGKHPVAMKGEGSWEAMIDEVAV